MATDSREITHADLVTLTAYMADHDYTAKEIAYAVEKPWKHTDVLAEALRAWPCPHDPTGTSPYACACEDG